MPPSSPPQKIKLKPQDWAIALATGLLGAYVGAAMFIPAALGTGTWYLGNKLLKPAVPAYLMAIAIMSGQLLWMIVGIAILGTWLPPLIIELIVFAIGIIWLWVRPSIAPVVGLTIYEAGALAINIMGILNLEMGSPEHKAMIVHILLRIAALLCLWIAYWPTRQQPSS
jgi:hypothetical protein